MDFFWNLEIRLVCLGSRFKLCRAEFRTRISPTIAKLAGESRHPKRSGSEGAALPKRVDVEKPRWLVVAPLGGGPPIIRRPTGTI